MQMVASIVIRPAPAWGAWFPDPCRARSRCTAAGRLWRRCRTRCSVPAPSRCYRPGTGGYAGFPSSAVFQKVLDGEQAARRLGDLTLRQLRRADLAALEQVLRILKVCVHKVRERDPHSSHDSHPSMFPLTIHLAHGCVNAAQPDDGIGYLAALAMVSSDCRLIKHVART